MISMIRQVARAYVKNHGDDMITQAAVAKKAVVSRTSTLQRSEEYNHKNNYDLSGFDYILCAVLFIVGVGMILYWTYSTVLTFIKNISKVRERVLKKRGDKT